MVTSSKVTALGAAVAAGVTAGVWKLGQKMGDITVFRSTASSLLIFLTRLDEKTSNRTLIRDISKLCSSETENLNGHAILTETSFQVQN